MKKIIYILLIFISHNIFAEDTWQFFESKVGERILTGITYYEDNNKVYMASTFGAIDIYDMNTNTWTEINAKNTKIPVIPELIDVNFNVYDIIVKNSIIYACCTKAFLVLSQTDTTVFSKYNSVISTIPEAHPHLGYIAMDSTGNIWAAPTSSFTSIKYRLFKYDGTELHKISVPEDIIQPGCGKGVNFMFDKNSNLWYISNKTGIVKYDGTNFISFDLTNLENSDINITSNEQIGYSYYDSDEDKIYIFINYHDATKHQTRLISIKDDKFYEEDISDIPIPWDKISIKNLYRDKNKNLYLGYVSNPAHSNSSKNFYIVTADKKVKQVKLPFDLTKNPLDSLYDNFFVDSQNYLWVSRSNGGVWRANLDKLLDNSIDDTEGLCMDIYIKPIYPMPIENRNVKVDIICFPKNINTLEVGLYNILGHKIMDIKNIDNYNPATAILKLDFDIPKDLRSGTYYLKVTSADETRTRGLVISQ